MIFENLTLQGSLRAIFENLTLQRFFQTALDVIAVAFIVYGIIRFVRQTRAGQLTKGLIVLALSYLISFKLELRALQVFLALFFQYSGIIAIVIFQPEIRYILEHIGRGKISKVMLDFKQGVDAEEVQLRCIKDVTKSVIYFQKHKIGALIVFERQTKLGEIIRTGTILNADSSSLLINNLFFNKSPLHDGAIIISAGKINAASCILPLSKNVNINTDFGTRHRAALGISEISDCISIVVSEETGTVSTATDGVIKRNYTEKSLFEELRSSLLENKETKFVKKIDFGFKRKTKK